MRESTKTLVSGIVGAVCAWCWAWIGAPLWLVLVLAVGAAGCLATGMQLRDLRQ